ncbi:MAG: MFS transporter [Thermomicrobiales bacterium]
MARREPVATAIPAADLDPALAPERTRFWGSLTAHPTFRLLWLAALSASAGQWMQQVALGWLAITLTASPGFVGIVTFAAGIPFIVVAPLGGVMIDRADRRQLMLVCQGLAMVLASVMAVDVIGGWVQPWHLPIAAFLNGSLQALLSPTQQSLVPSLVPRRDLTNAIGLMSAGQNMTRVVGPSIAGIVIGAIGVGETFIVQAIFIAISFSLVLRIVLPPRPARATGGRGVFDGIRLMASRPDLRGLFLLAAIPMFCVFPYISFLNVFALEVFDIGAQGLALLMAVSGCGAVVGSLMVASRQEIKGAGKLLVMITVIYGFVVTAVALSTHLWLSLPLMFLGSLLGAAFMGGNNVMLQHRVSDEIRGRVMGAYMLTWGLMPLGALPMGLAADRFGVQAAVAGGAIISTVLTAILGLASPAVREI